MSGYHKRRFPRQRHNSVLEIYGESSKTIAWTAKMLNFSMGGVSFATTKLLEKGTYLRARIRVMGKGVMEISGEIVWGRKGTNFNTYGVRFDSVKSIYS